MEAAQVRLSLHLSKCHIDGNHMLWPINDNKYMLLIRNATGRVFSESTAAL